MASSQHPAGTPGSKRVHFARAARADWRKDLTRSELVIRGKGHRRMSFSVGQLTPHDDDSFGLGGAAQVRVERRQRQSAPQREFQVRRIVQSKAMALR